MTKGMNEAIVKHFEVPDAIRQQAGYASWDLHYGSGGGGTEDVGDDGEPLYLGFTGACLVVREWCDDNLDEVWYDIQSGEVLTSEPEGHYDDEEITDSDDGEPEEGARWLEPDWEDYYRLEAGDVKRILFDKELLEYI